MEEPAGRDASHIRGSLPATKGLGAYGPLYLRFP